MKIAILFALALTALEAQPIEVRSFSQLAPLDGNWKFSTGDDPRFAAPDFDDSAWRTVRVPAEEIPMPLGICWIRFQVQLPDMDGPLTLLLPPLGGRYSLDNRRDCRIEMFVEQEGKQGSTGPKSIWEAFLQFFFANRIVLCQGSSKFLRVSANVCKHSFYALTRPSQVGRRSGCIQCVGLSYHQHFPNRQRRANNISLPPHDRVAKFDRRKLFMAQGFFDQLRGCFSARLAHTVSEAVQTGRLLIRQLEIDQSHDSFIVVTESRYA